MALRQSTYQGIRPYLQPGDLIAFGGEGLFSNVIKAITLSAVSHVGIVMETKLQLDGPQPGKLVDILESTTLDGKSGVQRNRMSDRVEDYKGNIWWLPINENIRKQMDMVKYFDYCLNQVGKPYNWIGAVLAGLHVPQFNVPGPAFCSQVAVACMQQSGVSELKKVIPANVTPEELCSFALYDRDYVQIKGDAKEIRAFNSTYPWVGNF